jgi:hypothetical protein
MSSAPQAALLLPPPSPPPPPSLLPSPLLVVHAVVAEGSHKTFGDTINVKSGGAVLELISLLTSGKSFTSLFPMQMTISACLHMRQGRQEDAQMTSSQVPAQQGQNCCSEADRNAAFLELMGK